MASYGTQIAPRSTTLFGTIMSRMVVAIAYNYVENMTSSGKLMTVLVQKNLHCVNYQAIKSYDIPLLFY